MGSIYKKGRPGRSQYDDISDIPHSSGEYRIRDVDGKVAYAGETNDLGRRVREHKKTGKLQPGESVDYLISDGRSTSRTRRKHEQATIEKYQPYRNKSIGGEGRIAGKKKREKEYRWDTYNDSENGVARFFKKLLLGILLILLVLVCIAFAAATIYYGWNYRLLFVSGGILFILIIMWRVFR